MKTIPYTRFILLRHGQSEGNLKDIVLGTLESKLTAKGIADALNRVKDVEAYMPSRFYASPIGRAQETCRVIIETLGIADFFIDDRLRERFVGSKLQGITQGEMQMIIGNEKEYFETLSLEQKLAYRFSEAEDAELPSEANARLTSFITEIGKLHVGETVLCVTHAAALSSFLAPRGVIAFSGLFGGDAIPNLGMFIIDYFYESEEMRIVSA